MRNLSLSTSMLLLAAACGGKTDDATPPAAAGAAGATTAGAAGATTAGAAGATSAGAAGTTSAGAGGAGGSGGAACLTPGAGQGPFPVKLTLKNDTSAPLSLWQECAIDHRITSCESGFSTPLVTSGACTIECGSSSGCIACGACLSEELTLAPGEAKELGWAGHTFTFSTMNGCACHDTHVAPAAAYRVEVPIYPTSTPGGPGGPGAPKPKPIRTVTKEFSLPAAGGLVEVSLAP